MTTVKEFCDKYGMRPKTVYKRITYNKNGKLAGHVVKEKGKPICFDEFAENFLKSTQARIAEISADVISTAEENDTLRDRVEELEYDNEQLSEELEKAKTENADLKAKAERLELDVENTKNNYNNWLTEKDELIAERDREIDRLKSELETEKNKSFIGHLMGKGK